MGEKGGLNLYGFVKNDGTDIFDLLGREPGSCMTCHSGGMNSLAFGLLNPTPAQNAALGALIGSSESSNWEPRVVITYNCNWKKIVKRAKNAKELNAMIVKDPDGEKCCCITQVLFLGHATRDMQFVGREDTIEVGKYPTGWEVRAISVGTTPQVVYTLPLKDRLCKGAVIFLHGCNTARVWPWEDPNEFGINMSRDMSEALPGVIVEGNRGKGYGLLGWKEEIYGIPRAYIDGVEVLGPW